MTSVIWNDKYNEDYTGEVTVSPSSGNGNAQVSISGSPNEGLDRSGMITASGSGVSREMSVVNEGRRHVFMTGDGLPFRTSDGSTYNTIKKTDIGVRGVIGLYSAKGLDNKRMSANPVWRDKSGLENHLQMKNFAWAGMSGVNGYSESFSKAVTGNSAQINSNEKITITGGNTSGVSIIYNTNKFSSYIKVTGLDANTSVSSGLYIYNNANGFSSAVKYTTDGIYKVDVSNESNISKVYIWGRGRQTATTIYDTPITVELIPLYSGAIVFDGVDDYGICETFPILTKEKGYTAIALRKWLSDNDNQCFTSNRTGGNAEYNAFNFELRINNRETTRSFSTSSTIVSFPPLVSYQTSRDYNGTSLIPGFDTGNKTLLVGALQLNSYFSNVALYSLVIIDHDTTEEERQLVIDYWKKEFPELQITQS